MLFRSRLRFAMISSKPADSRAARLLVIQSSADPLAFKRFFMRFPSINFIFLIISSIMFSNNSFSNFSYLRLFFNQKTQKMPAGEPRHLLRLLGSRSLGMNRVLQHIIIIPIGVLDVNKIHILSLINRCNFCIQNSSSFLQK